MDLGADDYLTKPFRRTELLQAISARLQQRQALLDQAEKKLDDLRNTINLSLPHEIRTPLAEILGFSELISSETSTIRLVELADIGHAIYESALRLLRVFDNFLAYAQIELLAASPQKIAALRDTHCANTAGLLHDLAQSRTGSAGRLADLALHLADGEIAMACEHLARLFNELLDNALKYSQPGTPVHVALQFSAGRAQLTIADQGRGMSETDIANIGAYMQFGRTVYERPGLGLGLVIARRLAALHGGDLTISSSLGLGTTVVVELPGEAVVDFGF
jgi:signal transduction histidine kinase